MYPDFEMTPLVLGSRSKSRRKLLERLSLPFSVVHPDIDESPHEGETPEALVSRLSEQKARAVAARIEAGLVIGSDQVALIDGSVLGKPGDHARNVAQLEMANGRWLEFRTGLVVLDVASGRVQIDVVPFAVKLKTLAARDIDAYVTREKAYDCAGGLRAESLGCTIIERMHGDDPSALLGLPMIRLCEMLREEGLDVLHVPRVSVPEASARERQARLAPSMDRRQSSRRKP